jgi:hypothetical protein
LEVILAGTSVPSERFEIVDGVRRAKAAQITGRATIPARIDDGSGALGPVIDLRIEDLLSPKPAIDVSSAAKFNRFKDTLDKIRAGSTPPPIIVIRGQRGRLIADVGFQH